MLAVIAKLNVLAGKEADLKDTDRFWSNRELLETRMTSAGDHGTPSALFDCRGYLRHVK